MATGTRSTYTDTGIQKRSIGDLIQMIDWTEAPLVRLLGTNNESKFRLVNWPRTKLEWIEDTMPPVSDALNGSINNSTTTVTVDNGDYFKAGDVVKIEDELVYVSSVSSNDLTVVRGFASTTAASHADNVSVEIVTIAALEAADSTTGYTTTTSQPFNYTQIISEAVKVSGSEQVDQKYGINDTLAYHLSKLIGGSNGIGTKFKAGDLVIKLQKTFYHGQRAAGTASTARAMGGFEYFVTTNVLDAGGAPSKRSDYEDKLEAIWRAGGTPDCIVCSSFQKRKLTQFFEGFITTQRSEERGGAMITSFETDFGVVEIVMDRWCPQDNAYILDKSKVGWVTYRPFDIIEKASTGDYVLYDVVGEFSFVVTNEKAGAVLKNFSQTQ